MHGCTDEVFAACSVGTCLTLLCYEHFDGTLSNVHELSCKGRRHPENAVLFSPGTTLPVPEISTSRQTVIPAQANNLQQPLIHPLISSPESSNAIPQPICTSAMATSSRLDADSTDQSLSSSSDINMFKYQSPFHPDVKLIPKQSLVDKNGKRVLSFQAAWFSEFPWLHYSSEVQGVLCYYCAKAEACKLSNLARKRERAFSVEGFSNWKKGIEKFSDHQKSQSHRFAMQQLVQSSKPVDQQLSTQTLTSQQQGRNCLRVLFTSLQHLARQGLAVRGHDAKSGNFMQLLKLRASDVPGLQEWMERKVNMTHSDIQNEILEMYSHSVVRNIVKQIQETDSFAVIVDGTQDISRKEQMSICIRYVDKDLCPHEEFLGLYEPPDTTGEIIARCILDALLRFQLPLSALRGQTYDGASNMSGKYKGCQALILEKQPLALYVHCGAHCTNLVSQSVCEAIVPVRDAMQSLQELGSLFSQSLKCRASFARIADSDYGVHKAQQIRPMCPTRWLVRVSAIQALVRQYELVLDCLEEMSLPAAGSNVAARASGLRVQLCKGSTLLALKMALKVFGLLEMLNRSLQARYQTVSGMLAAVDETLCGLRNLHTDEKFNQLLSDTSEIISELDLEEMQVPRQRKPPSRYTRDSDGHVANSTTVCDYYRPLYFLLVDTAVKQLEERFHDNSNLLKYMTLENVLIQECENVAAAVSVYEEINGADLQIQLELFRRKRSVKTVSDAVSIMKAMPPELRGEYCEVEKLVRLLLVSPASSTEAERSFSALRRLKTWLRSTMKQPRLNALAVLHIHQDVLDSVDVDALIEEFVFKNETRRSMFGQ